MTDGIRNSGKFNIEKNQGLSQAISKEIGLSREQEIKLGSVWFKVLQLVENAEVKSVDGKTREWSLKSANGGLLNVGDAFDLSNIWSDILTLVNDKLGTDFEVQKQQAEAEPTPTPNWVSPGREDVLAKAPESGKEVAHLLNIYKDYFKADVGVETLNEALERVHKDNLYYILESSENVFENFIKDFDNGEVAVRNRLSAILKELNNDLNPEEMTTEELLSQIKNAVKKKAEQDKIDIEATHAAQEESKNANIESRKKQDFESIDFSLPTIIPDNISKAQSNAKYMAMKLKSLKDVPAEKLYLADFLQNITKESLPYLLKEYPDFVNDLFEKFGEETAKEYLKSTLKYVGINNAELESISAEDINNAIINYSNRIISEHDEQIDDANSKKEPLQEKINSANKLLIEVAHLDPKPEIQKNGNVETVNYNGMSVKIRRGPFNKIVSIIINTEQNETNTANGNTYDYPEVTYNKHNVSIHNDEKTNQYSNKTTGYDFDALVNIAKQIFG